jgi:hypothetical protein
MVLNKVGRGLLVHRLGMRHLLMLIGVRLVLKIGEGRSRV